jgi:diaminohydroxyphosphoribosylaminopyrimidine deaminase / 5-amino-6-(5-phosphoribosylamino)uracil reductase
MPRSAADDTLHMRRALALARRALGQTRPNPMVGAVLVRDGEVLGEGWHHKAGQPHAEIEALRDATQKGNATRGATAYVTLEPCCTHGRTPPCTDALIAAGISRVVVAATDPNPAHAGHGFDILRHAGIQVEAGLLATQATRLNFGFNHWILHRTPSVTLKAAFTLDGKIATRTGESRWITGPAARTRVMQMRAAHDAILVGIQTVLADNPSLTIRLGRRERAPLRIILDTHARTPLDARVVSDAFARQTIVVTGPDAPPERVGALRERVTVWTAPLAGGRIDLRWLLAELGRFPITSLLVEGGGEVHASFLRDGLAHRTAFFYAPKVFGGTDAPRGIAGDGFQSLDTSPVLANLRHRRIGPDLLVEADLKFTSGTPVGEPGTPEARSRPVPATAAADAPTGAAPEANSRAGKRRGPG